MTMCMNSSVLGAGTMILIPDPRDTDDILKNIDKHRPAYYPGVPAMYVAINNHPEVSRYGLSSIKSCCSGAAPLYRWRYSDASRNSLAAGWWRVLVSARPRR